MSVALVQRRALEWAPALLVFALGIVAWQGLVVAEKLVVRRAPEHVA